MISFFVTGHKKFKTCYKRFHVLVHLFKYLLIVKITLILSSCSFFSCSVFCSCVSACSWFSKSVNHLLSCSTLSSYTVHCDNVPSNLFLVSFKSTDNASYSACKVCISRLMLSRPATLVFGKTICKLSRAIWSMCIPSSLSAIKFYIKTVGVCNE